MGKILRRAAIVLVLVALGTIHALAQTASKIGPTFGSELTAAGCADGVSWSPNGALIGAPGVDLDCARHVLAAHDPTRQPTIARAAPLSALLDPLTPTQRASITSDHMVRLQAEAAEHPAGALSIGNAKVVRAAADLGLTPDDWFRLAGF